MIAAVYRWPTGQVMVVDDRGNQMPEYNGLWEDRREAILRDRDRRTVFVGPDDGWPPPMLKSYYAERLLAIELDPSYIGTSKYVRVSESEESSRD